MYFFCFKSLILISSSLNYRQRLETSLSRNICSRKCFMFALRLYRAQATEVFAKSYNSVNAPRCKWHHLQPHNRCCSATLHFIFCKNHMPSWMHMARFQVYCCSGGYRLCLTCRMSVWLLRFATFQIVLLLNFLKSSGVLSINQKGFFAPVPEQISSICTARLPQQSEIGKKKIGSWIF